MHGLRVDVSQKRRLIKRLTTTQNVYDDDVLTLAHFPEIEPVVTKQVTKGVSMEEKQTK